MGTNSGTEEPLLARNHLDQDLVEAGFNQVSGGILPDNLMWTVYQHRRRISDVPRCLWAVTNLTPPACHLAGGWTDDPDRAYDQAIGYVQTWLRSQDSFASMRRSNTNAQGTGYDREDEASAGSAGPTTTQLLENANLVVDMIKKGTQLFGADAV